ncbi:MAG: SWIM zinc finger family protein, partial [Actinomycetota bacterium]
SVVGAEARPARGSCRGSGAEPYDTVVDHVAVGWRCSCPSRQRPCKHVLALLLLWVRGQVPVGVPGAPVESWLAARTRASGGASADDANDADDTRERVATDGDAAADDAGTTGDTSSATDRAAATGNDVDDEPGSAPEPPSDDERDRARDERVERMHAGLIELDRWLDDRIRTGLADPSVARFATWDDLAARLVDARAGSLANRIRRLAGLVGASPDWHDDVLAELGVLHLLSQAGRRLGSLPGPLGDAVATSVGWQVKRADVLAGVPDTDDWVVCGRSDNREDRIEVRRHWLRGRASGRWALVLSFAAYQQSLDTSLEPGTSIRADLHRYPGPALRALVGDRHGEPTIAAPPSQPVASACDEVGRMIAAEPWLDRVPTTINARLARNGAGWALTDATGSLPVLVPDHRPGDADGLATLLAHSAGEPVDLTVEWTPHGVVPLALHAADRTIDIGPRADRSFVASA